MKKLITALVGLSFLAVSCTGASSYEPKNKYTWTQDIEQESQEPKVTRAEKVTGEKINLPDPKIQKDKNVLVLEDKNTLTLRGPISSKNASRLQQKAMELSAKLPSDASIYLVLSSPGGSVKAGNKLIDFLKALPQEIKTITIFSASMAFHIAQNMDKRYILPSGTLMSHRASLAKIGGRLPGNLISRIEWMLTTIKRLDKIAAERMNIELKKYREKIQDEYWINGQSAVRDQAADEVILARCGSSMQEGRIHKKVKTIFGSFTLEYSKCPLITTPLSVKRGKMNFKTDLQKEKFNRFLELLSTDKKAFTQEFVVNGYLNKILKN